MARCYKNLIMRSVQRHREAISQAPNGLENPRETKAFAIGNQAGKWSITTVQIGNNFAHNFAHTVRDHLRRTLPDDKKPDPLRQPA